MRITSVQAEKILAANKKPTIAITINKKYKASVPQGTSTGIHEINPLPKKGITLAINFLNNKDFSFFTIEHFQDLINFEAFHKDIGGNGVLALQYAALRALADKKAVWEYINPKAKKLPIPLGNIIGGGAHSTQKGKTEFQEFLLIPQAKNFKENSLTNELIWRTIKQQHQKIPLTSEGAFVFKESSIEILDYLKNLTLKKGKELGTKIDLGLDIAASNFYSKGNYNYAHYSRKEEKKTLTREGQIGYVNHLIQEYSLKYVEDPLEENDGEGYGKITNTLTCGDDLTCTNIDLLRKYKHNIKAIIIKPNQIGSLVKTQQVVDYCKSNDIIPVISHRSGETTDDMISHLAVAWEIPYIKTGIHGKERRAKLATLEKIEQDIKGQ